jgi:uncharacterized protein
MISQSCSLQGIFSAAILMLSSLFAWGQTPEEDIRAYRKKQNDTFRNPAETPLSPEERGKFTELNYFPIDLAFRVEAEFVKHEKPEFFLMETTTGRKPPYSKYGEVHFTLSGEKHMLVVYQSPDIIKRPGYEDYLFIPFTDTTNGNETYEIGRYLEVRIGEISGTDFNRLVLDFNKAYNPYCAYSPHYSCPIPPAENTLEIAVIAGEKKYKPRP